MIRTVRSGLATVLYCLPGFLPCGTPPESYQPREIREAAINLLNAWYPRVVDTEFGGFIPVWSWNWENLDDNRKGLVTQARHTWSASKAALFFPDNPVWGAAAHAGFAFLKDAMWDTVFGGFYEFRDRTGRLPDPDNFLDTKRAYGNAFAIFALSAYYEWTGNKEALDLAEKTFLWIDRHARDPVYGGYFNPLLRDGTPMHRSDETFGMWDAYLAGLKDYNSTIHLLEAFTSLYRVRPDSLLAKRLHELIVLVRDTFVTDGGYLHLFFREDWTPVSYRDSTEAVRRRNTYLDHVSFGHDVETAFLLLEAAEALGLPPDPDYDAKTRRMVDHALAYGWDPEKGGLMESAYYVDGDTPVVIDRRKTWWVQAESLNSLLLMATRHPEDPRYRVFFWRQWAYIRDHMTDHAYGGWYETGPDTDPQGRFRPKGHHWKTPYHHLRALINCAARLAAEEE